MQNFILVGCCMCCVYSTLLVWSIHTSMQTYLGDLQAGVRDLQAGVGDLQAGMDTMLAGMDTMQASINELLGSTFTLRSAAVVDACARASVYLVAHAYDSCSAFAYAPPGGGWGGRPSRLWLVSAAHCFLSDGGVAYNFSGGSAITVMALGAPAMTCDLAATFGTPADSAVLLCEARHDAPRLRRRTDPVSLSLPVAAAGFTPDALNHSEYNILTNTALSVRLSRVGTTLGSGPAVYPTFRGRTDHRGFSVAGVVEQPTAPGMSGGPVLDKDCGVLGVNHISAVSSGFVSLDEVDAYLSAALSAEGTAEVSLPAAAAQQW